ncbi:MAG: FkbM family methyltransferase [Bacteroidota bacterium]
MKNYLSIILRHPRPVKFLLSRILMKLGISERILIRYPEYSLRFYPTPQIAQMWIDAAYSRSEEKFIRDFVKNGDNVIDIGANIGLITLLCARITGPTGSVTAIEANPRIFSYLRGNVALNAFGHVTCFNYGVSNTSGSLLFTDNSWDEINSVVQGKDQQGTITIPAERLDSIVPQIDSVSLLKIDVEGFEKFVLEGAEGILRRTRCIYFEYNAGHYTKYGYALSDIYDLLRQGQFTLYRFVTTDSLTNLVREYSSEVTENFIAVREPELLTSRTGYSIV